MAGEEHLQENEFLRYSNIILRYAQQSKLTPLEFFEARTALAKGILVDSDGVIMKPYKIIDFESFLQIEAAYIKHRTHSKQYEIGMSQIRTFLYPPDKILTKEEKIAKKGAFASQIEKDIRDDGSCVYAFLVYEFLMLLPTFKPFRDAFPIIYDQTFKAFIKKQKLHEKSYFTQKELADMVASHDGIMEKIKAKSNIKKSEFAGTPLQLTKNKIVENYFIWKIREEKKQK